ncbi:hypothetical protein [Providencia rettgeri]|uniref:hypothetical protein n=1 Tax=Providencia TaxID=586 RepID=UPI0024AA2F37|nr:hypothetical protein [Providencia rettgeri]WHT81935.1 hypothetical protein KOL65_22115 [Providencia rettgeri]
MSKLTESQLFDLLEYFTELANEGYINLSSSIESPNPDLYNSMENLHLGYYDLITFYFKDGFPIGFSDVLAMNHYY